MEDLVGKTLGRYLITSLIGRGGMATVYKARDPGLERVVALKILHSHLSDDPAFVARFRREAQAVAALRHPNIVQVYGFDSADDEYFMVMEYVDGPTLATLLRRLAKKGQRMSSEEVLRIFAPLCSAVDYANGEGMVHRDIKPANIILTRKGDPVITDYGIARIAGAVSYTMPGTVVGSAQYMSPEQAQGLTVDNHSDIYSLGVCLFEALTGRVPFDGDTTATILTKHLTAPVPSARALNPYLPATVEAVLSRVLAKAPSDRYPRAADLAKDLDVALRAPLATPGATMVEAVPLLAADATRVEAQTPGASSPGPHPASGTWPATSPSPGAWQVTPLPGAVPSGVPPAPYAGPVAGRRRRWPFVATLAALVVVGGGVIAFLVLRPPSPTTSSTATSTLASSTTVRPGTSGSTGPAATTTSTTTAEQAALLAQGDDLLGKGEFQEAIATYEKIVEEYPNDALARTQLGMAYYILPRKDELAREQLEAAVQLDPSDSRAWGFLGIVLKEMADVHKVKGYVLAEDDLRKAMALDPANTAARGFLGELMADDQREDLGLAQAERAVAEDPDDFFAQSSLGSVRASRGEWQEAVEPYRKALALQPDWPMLHLHLAAALRRTEQWDEALTHSQQVLQMDKGFQEPAYRSIAQSLQGKGDIQGAISNFQKAISIDNTDPFTEYAFGLLYHEQSQYDAALPHFQRAVALEPESGGYHAWVGACLDKLERWAEARAELELALKLDPSRGDVRKYLDDMTAKGH